MKKIFLIALFFSSPSWAQSCPELQFICMGWCEDLKSAYDYTVDSSAVVAFQKLQAQSSCKKLYAVDPITGEYKKDAAQEPIVATPFNTCYRTN